MEKDNLFCLIKYYDALVDTSKFDQKPINDLLSSALIYIYM